MFRNLNIWFFASFLISIIVAIPIVTVFSSFFEDTSNYFEILKQTFFIEYILNSLTLLIGVLFLTFVFASWFSSSSSSNSSKPIAPKSSSSSESSSRSGSGLGERGAARPGPPSLSSRVPPREHSRSLGAPTSSQAGPGPAVPGSPWWPCLRDAAWAIVAFLSKRPPGYLGSSNAGVKCRMVLLSIQ